MGEMGEGEGQRRSGAWGRFSLIVRNSRRVGTRATRWRDLESREAHLAVMARRARTEVRATPAMGLDALRLRDRADMAGVGRGGLGCASRCATEGRSKARDRVRNASIASRTPRTSRRERDRDEGTIRTHRGDASDRAASDALSRGDIKRGGPDGRFDGLD